MSSDLQTKAVPTLFSRGKEIFCIHIAGILKGKIAYFTKIAFFSSALFVFRIAVKEILREQISLQYCQERIGVPRRMRS